MNLTALYDIKLGCNNCGMADFYKVERGYEFLDFEFDETGGHALSRLREGLGDMELPYRPLPCHNCFLPCLVMVGWGKDEKPVPLAVKTKKATE